MDDVKKIKNEYHQARLQQVSDLFAKLNVSLQFDSNKTHIERFFLKQKDGSLVELSAFNNLLNKDELNDPVLIRTALRAEAQVPALSVEAIQALIDKKMTDAFGPLLAKGQGVVPLKQSLGVYAWNNEIREGDETAKRLRIANATSIHQEIYDLLGNGGELSAEELKRLRENYRTGVEYPVKHRAQDGIDWQALEHGPEAVRVAAMEDLRLAMHSVLGRAAAEAVGEHYTPKVEQLVRTAQEAMQQRGILRAQDVDGNAGRQFFAAVEVFESLKPVSFQGYPLEEFHQAVNVATSLSPKSRHAEMLDVLKNLGETLVHNQHAPLGADDLQLVQADLAAVDAAAGRAKPKQATQR